MVSLRDAVALGLVLLGAMAGCASHDESNPAPKYKYPSETDFCKALAQADCSDAVVTGCYGAVNDANRASCVSARSAPGSCNPNGLAYHPQSAEGCVAAHAAVYNDATLTQAELKSVDAACLPVLNNGMPEGATCTADTDCDATGGLRCIIPLGETSGTCNAPISVDPGKACTDPSSVCADGYYCISDGYCVVERDVGQTCSPTQPCQSAFNCIGDTATSGTCQPKLDDGSTCSDDTDCKSGFCVKAAGTTMGRCTTNYQLTSLTEACSAFQP